MLRPARFMEVAMGFEPMITVLQTAPLGHLGTPPLPSILTQWLEQCKPTTRTSAIIQTVSWYRLDER